ncbi:polyphosphate kinase 2 family protein [Undibacterium sp. Jales W-56]|uniref:PPK2 family polyphosphate kinase n=1 Tax=Undibacterium sp. Jales W-56 TaxID=2897325 RepID=UPI0021D3B3FA|nr:PPK2 family polyphosphate kinase [Undibacterium sp. Jales W-56]MCU6434363.1 polyphosphate kinase 2 family protein [Undibacterium sp. Jales W-56]
MSISQLFRSKEKLVLQDENASLKLIPASKDSKADSKAADKLSTLRIAEELAVMQEILYAEKKHKLLIVLQGMDTSGKDGTARGVFGAINPLGARAVAFKAPTAIEKEHDYLWRIHQQLPASGEIVIFNRSHYEDVLITRVHDWIDEAECKRRLGHIRDFEKMLAETGTVMLKFFLHISAKEQKERLEERLADPAKNWKFDPQDLVEREFWNSYQRQYEKVIMATDADHAPWYVIPSDSKTQRNLAIASIVQEKLISLKLSYPPGNPELSKIKVS